MFVKPRGDYPLCSVFRNTVFGSPVCVHATCSELLSADDVGSSQLDYNLLMIDGYV